MVLVGGTGVEVGRGVSTTGMNGVGVEVDEVSWVTVAMGVCVGVVGPGAQELMIIKLMIIANIIL